MTSAAARRERRPLSCFCHQCLPGSRVWAVEIATPSVFLVALFISLTHPHPHTPSSPVSQLAQELLLCLTGRFSTRQSGCTPNHFTRNSGIRRQHFKSFPGDNNVQAKAENHWLSKTHFPNRRRKKRHSFTNFAPGPVHRPYHCP